MPCIHGRGWSVRGAPVRTVGKGSTMSCYGAFNLFSRFTLTIEDRKKCVFALQASTLLMCCARSHRSHRSDRVCAARGRSAGSSCATISYPTAVLPSSQCHPCLAWTHKFCDLTCASVAPHSDAIRVQIKYGGLQLSFSNRATFSSYKALILFKAFYKHYPANI